MRRLGERAEASMEALIRVLMEREETASEKCLVPWDISVLAEEGREKERGYPSQVMQIKKKREPGRGKTASLVKILRKALLCLLTTYKGQMPKERQIGSRQEGSAR